MDWCQRNHLQLNTGKTKELVVDFCRHKQPCTQVNILGMAIEIVTFYKYLGVHLKYKLDWTDHTAATYKKDQSRLYLPRMLRSFGLQVVGSLLVQELSLQITLTALGSSLSHRLSCHVVSCHVIVQNCLSLSMESQVLLLEPIPALTQGEGSGQVASSSP